MPIRWMNSARRAAGANLGRAFPWAGCARPELQIGLPRRSNLALTPVWGGNPRILGPVFPRKLRLAANLGLAFPPRPVAVMRHTVYGKRRAVCGEGLGESEQGEGTWIPRGSIKPLHGLPELGPDRIHHREQRHTGAEFHVIGDPNTWPAVRPRTALTAAVQIRRRSPSTRCCK